MSPATTPVRILVTGFDPFGGSALNPSREILPLLERDRPNGVVLETALLPVVGGDGADGAPARLRALVERHRPDALLCLGETGSRGAICVERVALNLRDYRIADNAGVIVRDEPVTAGAPAAFFSTLPVRDLVASIGAIGVPCELSLNAGAFLCNEIMYHAIALASTHGVRAAGFIHVPRLPEQLDASSQHRPSLSLDRSAAAIRCAVACIAKHLR